MPTNQELTMLSVFALVVTYAKAWVFARWKPSMLMQFLVDQSIWLLFLFLIISALYNATRTPEQARPAGLSSVASAQLIHTGQLQLLV